MGVELKHGTINTLVWRNNKITVNLSSWLLISAHIVVPWYKVQLPAVVVLVVISKDLNPVINKIELIIQLILLIIKSRGFVREIMQSLYSSYGKYFQIVFS